MVVQAVSFSVAFGDWLMAIAIAYAHKDCHHPGLLLTEAILQQWETMQSEEQAQAARTRVALILGEIHYIQVNIQV